MRYEEAKELLGKKSEKKLKHMTTLRSEGPDFCIRYWNTDVVTLHSDGTYTLRNGGYQTNTTKDRVNEYSPVNIYQKKYEWFLWDANNTPFVDGMKVEANGRPI